MSTHGVLAAVEGHETMRRVGVDEKKNNLLLTSSSAVMSQ